MGKSTLKAKLEAEGLSFGRYLNADDIARTMTGDPRQIASAAQQVVREQRDRAMAERVDYCWETVMSHPSHIEHLRAARAAGYESMLVYVATDDPRISIGRVADRVTAGGHDVPLDRIVERYAKSLILLQAALRTGTPALLFDNSLRDVPFRLVARVAASAMAVELRRTAVPRWFGELVAALDDFDLG